MCTSIVTNFNKTIIGWNLDLLDMQWKVFQTDDMVCISINDKTEGWLPLFGANRRGDFVAMPTCWPYDSRSDFADGKVNIINLDIDLLLQKRSFAQTKEFVQSTDVCSVPGVTFQAQLSDKNGNALQIIPGQGYKYLEKPTYSVLTNFSPFKGDSELHPWMGLDRFNTAQKMLSEADKTFSVDDMFAILQATSQQACPTVVSMVFDVTDNVVYWCENCRFDSIEKKVF